MSLSEWMVELWYIPTMEYFSAMKRKKLLIQATTYMDLRGINLKLKILYTSIFI